MVRIRGGEVIINIKLKDHLLQLEVNNNKSTRYNTRLYIALRECGHICASEEALQAPGCINCTTNIHAPDCVVCALLNK